MYNYPYFGLPNYMNYINARSIPNMHSTPVVNKIPTSNIPSVRPQQFSKSQYNSNIRNFKNSEIHKNPYSYANMQSNNFSKSPLPPPPNIPKNSSSTLPPIIDIFGIKLYFDDILIICLIFFLFNEQSTDYFLLFTLALLLLT